jgi:Leucine-rich repeat (LRR) protein
MGDEEGEAPAAEEEVVVVSLTAADVERGISMLCKSVDGTSYAYTKLTLPGEEEDKMFTEISKLSEYPRLRYVDLSKNKIKDISPLLSMPHLLAADLATNLVDSISVFSTGLDNADRLKPLDYLQFLDLTENKLTELPNINLPFLTTLTLNNNQISSVQKMELVPKLSTLALNGNQITSLQGLPPSLIELSMMQNQITSLEGIQNLPKLKILNLQENQLKLLTGFTPAHSQLRVVRLKANQVTRMREPGVSCLKVLLALEELDCSENPVAEVEAYRVRCKRRIPTLKLLDEAPFEEDEVTASREPEDMSEGSAMIEPPTPPPEAEDAPAEE